MPSFELVLLVPLVLIAWLWLDSIKVREAAVKAARAACDTEGLLLLDDTVAIAAVKPSRDADGHLKLQRTYDFEYSDTGNNRRNGSVVLLGQRVVLFNVGFREPAVVRTLPSSDE
ncbi:MAG TPA: DUF3301 domain-containing protein [Burkholderiales bacterium]|nr:DUF3301 domain-containing protein [Burkholderiales bacterium]